MKVDGTCKHCGGSGCLACDATKPFPKSRSQIRRLIAQSEDKMFEDAKPSTKAERKSFDAIAKKLKTHYQFCVDNDDSCICDQAKDGDKLYVSAPVSLTVDGLTAKQAYAKLQLYRTNDSRAYYIRDSAMMGILEAVKRGGFNDGKADAIEDMAMAALRRKR